MPSNAQLAPAGTPINVVAGSSEPYTVTSAFARLSLTDRIALACSMQAGYLRIAEQSVRAACAAIDARNCRAA